MRVIRELAAARAVLDRLRLEEPGPYVARVVRGGVGRMMRGGE